MSDWTSGYVADIGYTHGYYPELNPLRVKLAFLNAGLVYPEFGAACELGFGQGVSANVHAAASISRWFGTDFNPSQAAYAQELARASGSDAQLFDGAFLDFCVREDLPDFDYIGLHGIWSWVNDENRAVIVEFVRRKLKVGGVLYVSYNTLPGWSTFAPIRHLMTEHADVVGSDGKGIISRVTDAINFADALMATNPAYMRANPQIADRITGLKSQNRNYLAHEYFNRDWDPMHFATMADWLAPAKVSYACSANYLDHVDVANLTKDQQAFLAELPDPMFRQSVRDYMVNQQFRKDYWIKGPRNLSPLERSEGLRAIRVVLTTHRLDVPLKVAGSVGEVTLSEAIYAPILDLLADHKPQSLGKLEAALMGVGITLSHILEVCLVLTGMGHLCIVQDDQAIGKARKTSDRLNSLLISKARSSNDTTVLSSPVTGGGVSISRFQQLFVLALGQGKKTPEDLGRFAWQILASQGQKILKDGVVLNSDEENLAEITEQAEVFHKKHLPIFRALQIV